MADALELGLDVAGGGDITVGQMAEVELDAGLQAPFQRLLRRWSMSARRRFIVG